MDKGCSSGTSAGRNMGGRSYSMNAKGEQGPPIAPNGRSALKVEYSMVNYDFSMHESMSGDSAPSDDDSNNGDKDDKDNEDDEDLEESRRRIVMMHDDDGNPVPVNMAQFYYDSVQPSVVNSNPQQTASPAKTTHPSYGTSNLQPRCLVPHRPRGVQLSSSSEEEDNGPSRRSGHNRSKPTGIMDEDDDSLDINKHAGRKFIPDDEQYDELDQEKGEGDGISDKYQNQFMRIAVPASELKDVSRVKKDLDHDRPKAGRGMNIIAGLQRAVSGVKIGEGDRARTRAQTVKSSSNRVVGGMQRTSSQRSGLHRTGASSAQGGLERSRESVVGTGGKRQAIGNIGRMISINRHKGGNENVVKNAGQSSSVNESQGSSSQLSFSHESLGQLRKKEADVSDEWSQRSMVSGSSDRPRSSKVMSGTSGRSGRASLAQVGRILSRNRRKSSMQLNVDRPSGNIGERTDDRRPSARASLSRIGRALSLTREKAALTGSAVTSSDAHVNRDGKQISPLSTSTVSTTSMCSPLADRDRAPGAASGNKGPAKREPRLSLRGAGRMFSLTRRTTGDGGLERKRTAPVGRDDGARDSRGLAIQDASKARSKKIGDNAVGVGVAGGSQKVDGRADKFVYSEVISPVIADSGLVGNGKHIRVPMIAMAEFSEPVVKDKWYIDVFTLPHNAVRRECIDLYDMLSALARCDAENDLCDEDIEQLEKWWNVANGLFRCYFEMERQVLFPWVDSAGSQEWEVQLALKKMRSLKDKLETLFGKVERVWNEKTFKNAGEMYGLLYKAVDDFVPRLMNYFVDQEVLLPAIVKEFYKREHRTDIDNRLVAAFMAPSTTSQGVIEEECRHNIVLLVRWMTKSKQLRAWLGKSLSSSARSLYPSWYQMYEEDHASVVKSLRSRATTSVAVETRAHN